MLPARVLNFVPTYFGASYGLSRGNIYRHKVVMKLLEVIKSPIAGKKWRAVFEGDSGRLKHTDFGAAGMDDYTLTHSKEQRERYRTRHSKDLTTKDPTRAGFLSYYLLWGDSTSLKTNIASYRRKFF